MLKKISTLKQVILVSPSFKLKKEFFDGLDVVIDNSKKINKYIEDNNIVDLGKINLINYIDECYKDVNYDIRNFYLTKDNNLAFISEKKVFVTDVNVFDVKFFDDVVEKVFNANWIIGYIRMYSYYGYYPTIKLNICKGESNNEN